MSILLLLISLALVIGLVWLIVFLWAVKSGQYEDMEGPAQRILFDDDENENPLPKKDS